ncbi:MAG TPA: outer membrane beta-barrel protein [Bryobacteraceae bacterium]|nr:outer membrane beta-barrel protein [Bryobacteraceae bacterium]
MFWKVALFCLAATMAAAQQREVGIQGGGGIFTGASLAGTPATASFAPGPMIGVLVGQDVSPHWSGEIRYEYERDDLRVVSGGQSAAMAGDAHALHYDLIWNSRTRREHLRPYIAAGAGLKLYRGAGAEEAYRPLMQYAYLTHTQQWEPLIAAGGGIKMSLSDRLELRLDLRDQITPFPNKVITAASGSKISGWLHDLVPSVALSWRF